MKWYLAPDGVDFPRWSPGAIKRHVPNVSFPRQEPAEALTIGAKQLMPLTDDGASPPEGKAVDARTVEVDGGTAIALYTYRNLTTEEIDERHAARSQKVNAERDRRIVAGATFTVTAYGTIPLTGREEDKVILTALLVRAQALIAQGVTNPVMVIRDRDNETHTLTPAQMAELIGLAFTWVEDTMQVSWAMKDATGDFPAGIPADYATNESYWP